MVGYSEAVLERARNYLKGEKPNKIYMYRGKMVVIHSLGGKYRYTDNFVALDPRNGDVIPLSLYEMGDFRVVAERIE